MDVRKYTGCSNKPPSRRDVALVPGKLEQNVKYTFFGISPSGICYFRFGFKVISTQTSLIHNTCRYPRQFTCPGIKVFRQKNTSIFFIKPSKVSKIYVFQKFYRWDKPLNDLFTNYRLSKVEHAR